LIFNWKGDFFEVVLAELTTFFYNELSVYTV